MKPSLRRPSTRASASRSRRPSGRTPSACRRSRAARRRDHSDRGAARTIRMRRRPSPRRAARHISRVSSSRRRARLGLFQTHHPRQQRRDRHVWKYVDGLGPAVDAVKKFRKRTSSPTACRLSWRRTGSPRPGSSSASRVRGPQDATGAKPNPQLPMTTEVTPCQLEIEQYGSQKSCAS